MYFERENKTQKIVARKIERKTIKIKKIQKTQKI